MDLTLAPALAGRYTSSSQIARVVSESWAVRELFCPACPTDRLAAHPVGMRVSDFFCPHCTEDFQVKAKRGAYGSSVANSAYQAKIDAIRTNTVPNYVFLSYDASKWKVTDGFLVPGHFITESVIRARRPLSLTARRAGWVGSNILLGELPSDARVALIQDGVPRDVASVRKDWKRFEFLKHEPAESRGWTRDLLSIIRALPSGSFHLSDLYEHRDELARLHPNNRHIPEKVRQQVFALRDRGVLRPLGKGRYELAA